jgi:hypothetical protein
MARRDRPVIVCCNDYTRDRLVDVRELAREIWP